MCLAEMYPDIKLHLEEQVRELNSTSGFTVKLEEIFKVRVEKQSFFDAVLVVDCQSEDSYRRAFESYVDAPTRNVVNLSSQNDKSIAKLDFGQLTFRVEPSQNPFSLLEGLLHQKEQLDDLCQFYQHFRRSPDDAQSIVHRVSDKDLTKCIDQVSKVMEEIVDFKTAYFNRVLVDHSNKKKEEEKSLQLVELLKAKKLRNAILPNEELKKCLDDALFHIKASSLCAGKSQLCKQMIELWREYALAYKSEVQNCLFEFNRAQRTVTALNGNLFDRFLETLEQTDDRDLHLNNFISEYNDFTFQFQDLLNLAEVKSEFHLRSVD